MIADDVQELRRQPYLREEIALPHNTAPEKPKAFTAGGSLQQLPLDGITRLLRSSCGAVAAGVTCKEEAQYRHVALAGSSEDGWTSTIMKASQSLLHQAEETCNSAVNVPALQVELKAETGFVSAEPQSSRLFVGVPLQEPGGRLMGVLWVADKRTEETGSRQNVFMDCIRGAADQIEAMIALQCEVSAARQAAGEQDMFFQFSHEMFAIIGKDGYIKRVNPAFERTTGFTQQEALSLPFTEFIHPDDLEATNSNFERLKTGAAAANCENRCRYKDGSYHWLSWTASPVTEEGLLYAAAHDITASRDIEEELRRSNEELERFAYVASHDLQEPLRMVASYVQLLARRYKGRLDTDADEFIHFAVDGTQRMQKLIEDLLTYSRIGRRGNGFAPTDCGAALRQAMAHLEFAIQEQQAAITCDTLPVVLADFSQLVQLFQNILANSLKFHSAKPVRIHISVREEMSEYIFCVRDNGIGIAPSFYKRVFVLFQRLHTQDEYPGTGIGLALCKKIVEGHRGRIWIEHVYDGGTALHFALPMAHPTYTANE